MEVDGEKGSGTLKDGILTLEILGMTMYFVQEGMEPPEIGAAPAEASAVEEPEAEPSEPAEQSQTPETEPSAAPAASLDPVSGDLGECHVDILGAESFEDAEGQPGIRFYYDFTNNSDPPVTKMLSDGMTPEEICKKALSKFNLQLLGHRRAAMRSVQQSMRHSSAKRQEKKKPSCLD